MDVSGTLDCTLGCMLTLYCYCLVRRWYYRCLLAYFIVGLGRLVTASKGSRVYVYSNEREMHSLSIDINLLLFFLNYTFLSTRCLLPPINTRIDQQVLKSAFSFHPIA